MRATMYGWEIVCPWPIGSAASAYARWRSPCGTKSSRGTRSIASSTRSSTMSRPRSWSSTIRWRGVNGHRRTPQLLEDARRDVDRPRGRRAGADGDHRHFRVALLERAVAPAAGVVAPAEVGELDSGRGGDDQVAGVRVGERGPRALERVRLDEDGRVPGRLPAAVGRGEPKLAAVQSRHRLVVFPEQHDVTPRRRAAPPALPRSRGNRAAGRPCPARFEAVTASCARTAVPRGGRASGRRRRPGAAPRARRSSGRGRSRAARRSGRGTRPARRPPRAASRIAPVRVRERGVRGFRPGGVRGEVVVREVEDEEVEAVARDEPAPDHARVVVHGAARPCANGQRRAGHVRLEEVEVEEPARPVRRPVEPGNERQRGAPGPGSRPCSRPRSRGRPTRAPRTPSRRCARGAPRSG